jgi:hypothetical protein
MFAATPVRAVICRAAFLNGLPFFYLPLCVLSLREQLGKQRRNAQEQVIAPFTAP